MERSLPWRLVGHEIRGNLGFCVSFVVNLSLGLIGLLTLNSFNQSIANQLQVRSQVILGADLRVSARRALETRELELLQEALPDQAELRREEGLFTMVANGDRSRLVELRAIDRSFPYYGGLHLRSGGAFEAGMKPDIVGTKAVWVYPEILVQLGVAVGEAITIGGESYRISDVVEDDPSQSAVGFSVAPKVYIDRAAVEGSSLLARGSRVTRSVLFRLPKEISPNEFKNQLAKLLPAPDLRIVTHGESSQQIARLTGFVGDYLGLVALVALFLAGVGAAFLFKSFLLRRSKDMAILLGIGCPKKVVRITYILQLMALGLTAATISLLLVSLGLPYLPELSQGLVDPTFSLSLPWQSAVLAALLGVVGPVIFCLPTLTGLGTLQPLTLLQGGEAVEFDEASWPYRLSLLPSLILYWMLAVWQAHSITIGSLFVGLLFCSGILFQLLGRLALTGLAKFTESSRAFIHLLTISLTRYRSATLACFLAIGLGSLLLNLIPQLRYILERELDPGATSSLPGLFMFDIQDEQLAPLQQLAEQQGYPLNYTSPLVRARLVKLKGQEVEALQEEASTLPESREDERRQRFQSRSYNLSWRAGLASSETLVEGRQVRTLPPAAGSLPEISLEERFAERLDLSLGDTMTFDVQGVEIKGVVVNLRKVKWTSFQPNFFVQFQPHVLEEAPKTWVAALPPISFDQRMTMQTTIVEAFPNVAIVDVEAVVGRLLKVMDQVTKAVGSMALLALLAGLAVLFSIARHQATTKQRDVTLLKALGLSFRTLQLMVGTEFLLLGGAAAVLGAAVSAAVSYVITETVFESPFAFDWNTPVVASIVTTAMVMVTGWIATRSTLRQPTIGLLKQ